jgi:hypothetical protein
MIGTMKMPPLFTISHMLGTIPKSELVVAGTPPMERESRSARDRDHGYSPRGQRELDAAIATRVEDVRPAPPAIEHTLPGLRAVDTAGGNSQSRRDGSYPLW